MRQTTSDELLKIPAQVHEIGRWARRRPFTGKSSPTSPSMPRRCIAWACAPDRERGCRPERGAQIVQRVGVKGVELVRLPDQGYDVRMGAFFLGRDVHPCIRRRPGESGATRRVKSRLIAPPVLP